MMRPLNFYRWYQHLHNGVDSESEGMDSENYISSGRSSESVLILGTNILHLRSRGEIGTPSPNASPTSDAYGDISAEIEDT